MISDALDDISLSVVIATYNGEATIERSMGSVCASAARFELIVVDDGSIDATADLIRRSSDQRVVLVTQQNMGRSAARNAGLRLARGGFVMFLDDDDWLSEGTIDRVIETTSREPAVDVVRLHAWYRNDDPGSDDYVVRSTTVFDESPSLPGTFVVRREVLLTAGGYDERLHYAENTELLYRVDDLLAAGHRTSAVVVIDEGGLNYSFRSDGAARYRPDRIEATKLLLEEHRERMLRQPQLRATLLGIQAHDLYRSGRARSAIRPAWSSLLARPGLRPAGRLARILAASIVP